MPELRVERGWLAHGPRLPNGRRAGDVRARAGLVRAGSKTRRYFTLALTRATGQSRAEACGGLGLNWPPGVGQSHLHSRGRPRRALHSAACCSFDSERHQPRLPSCMQLSTLAARPAGTQRRSSLLSGSQPDVRAEPRGESSAQAPRRRYAIARMAGGSPHIGTEVSRARLHANLVRSGSCSRWSPTSGFAALSRSTATADPS